MAVAAEALLRLRTVFDGSGIDTARRALGGLEREAKSIGGSFKEVVNSRAWQGAAVGATGIGAGLVYSGKKAIELETQMAQVRKVVNFEKPDGLRNLTQGLVDLSTQVPYTAKELGELAASAGMAGFAEKDIPKFVKAAAVMGTAFNMPAKEAGDAMVAMQAGMGLTLDGSISTGDAINHLSDNMQGVVEPAALVDVVKRVGAIGVASGLSSEQVAGLGAAFLAPGTNAEVAATGMKNFLKALTIGDAGSTSFKSAFGQIGLDAQQVAKDMQTKAVPTIKNVLTRIAALPKEMQAGVISKIFGEESKAAIMPLLSNLKLVDQAFGLVENKSKYAGSMQKEFANQLNTTDAQLKLFQNNLNAVATIIGQALLPGINGILTAVIPVLSIVGDLIQRFPVLSYAIAAAGAAFIGLVAAATGLGALLPVISLLSRLSILATIAGWLGAVGPWLARIAPWVLNIGSVVARIGPILGSLMPVLLTVGRVLLGIFTGPVGWATLLISAGVALYAFRDKIAQFFTWLAPSWNTYVVTPLRNLWNTFLTWVGSTFSTLGPQLAAAFTGLSTAFQTYVVVPIQTIWGIFLNWVQTTLVTAAVSWWTGVTSGFSLYVVQPVQIAFNSLITWIGQAITQLRTWFSTIWTGIAQGFSTFVLIPIQTAWGMFSQWFQQTANNLRASFSQMWSGLSQGFNANVVQPVQQGWNTLVQFVAQGVANLRQALGGAWSGVTAGFNAAVVQPLQQGWGGVLQWMQSAATAAARGFASAFNGVASAISNNMIRPLQQAFQNLVSWAQGIISRLSTWVNNAVARIRSAMSGGGGGVAPAPAPRQGLRFDEYAKGGYVNGPTLAWVGEGRDSEYIIPSGKMAAASAAYLNGARGMDVINGKIPGFARGGVVGRQDPNAGTGFTSYDSKEYKAYMERITGKKYDLKAARVGATTINGKTVYHDDKNFDKKIRKIIGQTNMKAAGNAMITSRDMQPRPAALNRLVNRRARPEPPSTRAMLAALRAEIAADTNVTQAEAYDYQSRFIKISSGNAGYKMGAPVYEGRKLSLDDPIDVFGSYINEYRTFRDREGNVTARYRRTVYLDKRKVVRGQWEEYASGGYVKGPTLAWVGEGRDPGEYIIPSSRMAQSAMAYLNGARGAAVLRAPGFATGGYVGGSDRSGSPLQALMDRVGTIDTLTVNQPAQPNDGPINITTGPVLEFDGQRYVTLDDYQRGLRDVKRQTLGELRTAAGRRATGR